MSKKHIDYEHIKNFYNTVDNVWNNDPWHNYSQSVIHEFIKEHSDYFSNKILNAGSAGNTYDLICTEMYHVDIAENKLKNIDNAICANIENMPFENQSFDAIICVGSVINYCDAMSVIKEFSRLIRKCGYVILEFESSGGFEYWNSPCFDQDAYIIETSYIEENHTQWLYSPSYIYNILSNNTFKVIDKKIFHILDGIAYHFMSEAKAVSLARKTDSFIEKMPLLNKHGNNIILCAKKL